MPARVLARAMALAMLLAACAEEPAPGPPLQRLRLEQAPGGPARPEARVVEAFDAVAEQELWVIEAPAAGVGALPGVESPPLLLAGAAQEVRTVRLSRPGRYDLTSFDQVHVVLAFEGNRPGLRVEFLAGDEVVARTSAEPILAHGRVTTVVLPLEETAAPEADTLVVNVRGGRRQVGLGHLLLVDEPAAARLPPSSGGAQLVRVGEVARRGVGLVAGARLVAPAQFAAGAVLGFGLHVPDGLVEEVAGGSARLTVERAGSGGTGAPAELGRWPLQAGGFTDVRIPAHELAPWRGPVTLAWSLDLPEQGGGEVGGCIVSDAAVWVPRERPPPVLLVTSDTHRGDHLGVSEDGADVLTPVLDGLAARGLRFTDCLAPINNTNPSHVSLMTATHPRVTGILDNFTPVGEAAPTLAEAFAAAGFVTVAAVSSRHLGPDGSGLGQGFDRVAWPYVEAQRSAPETLPVFHAWVDALDDRPLFAWLHLFDAHTPYEPEASFLERHYDPARDPRDPATSPLTELSAALPRDLRDVRDLEYPRALYRAEVDGLDARLAPVFGHPRLAQGVIAFTADHGEALGEHGVYFQHMGLYPAVLHIPLILAGPGVPAGATSPAPVLHTDLGRTLLDLAGLEQVPFPGRNLVSPEVLSASTAPPRFTIEGHGSSAAVSHDGWHLVLHLAERDQPYVLEPRQRHEVELYDTVADPRCTTNVVEEHPDRAATLASRLRDWLTRSETRDWVGGETTDPELVETLQQLGYVEPARDGEAQALFEPDGCSWCERFGG